MVKRGTRCPWAVVTFQRLELNAAVCTQELEALLFTCWNKRWMNHERSSSVYCISMSIPPALKSLFAVSQSINFSIEDVKLFANVLQWGGISRGRLPEPESRSWRWLLSDPWKVWLSRGFPEPGKFPPQQPLSARTLQPHAALVRYPHHVKGGKTCFWVGVINTRQGVLDSSEDSGQGSLGADPWADGSQCLFRQWAHRWERKTSEWLEVLQAWEVSKFVI